MFRVGHGVLIARFCFLGKIRPNMICREISRPPIKTPNHAVPSPRLKKPRMHMHKGHKLITIVERDSAVERGYILYEKTKYIMYVTRTLHVSMGVWIDAHVKFECFLGFRVTYNCRVRVIGLYNIVCIFE